MANEAELKQSYPMLAIVIHWITALFVLGLIPAGLLMANMDEGPTQDRLFTIHESIGLLVFGLTLVRLAWKAMGGLPKPAAVLTPFERMASQSAHGLLYLLLLITPIIGWFGVGAFGGDVDLFGVFSVPTLLAKDEVLADQIFNVHLACGILIVLLVIAHVVGAVVHSMRGDGVMQRMLPGRK